MGWLHVVPENDLIVHTTESDEYDCCICGPTLDFEYQLVIHDSLDRRECFETQIYKE